MAKKGHRKAKILLSQACEGIVRYKAAIGLSEHTIADYQIAFNKLTEFLKDDPPLSSITREQFPRNRLPRLLLPKSGKPIAFYFTTLAIASWWISRAIAFISQKFSERKGK